MKILVLDDSHVAQTVISLELKNYGFPDHKCFSHVAEALSELQKNSYDVIILDYFLSGVTADTVIDKIRLLSGYTITPIIVVSSMGQQEEREKVFKKNNVEFFYKNAIPSYLGEFLISHLELNKILKKASILIVEDSKTYQSVLSEFLNGTGVRFNIAGDIKTASNLFSQHAHNLILVDFELPDGNGIEFASSIRSRFSNFDTQIILMTTHDLSNKLENAFKIGINDFIRKPFTSEELETRIFNSIKIIYSQRIKAKHRQINDKLLVQTEKLIAYENMSEKFVNELIGPIEIIESHQKTLSTCITETIAASRQKPELIDQVPILQKIELIKECLYEMDQSQNELREVAKQIGYASHMVSGEPRMVDIVNAFRPYIEKIESAFSFVIDFDKSESAHLLAKVESIDRAFHLVTDYIIHSLIRKKSLLKDDFFPFVKIVTHKANGLVKFVINSNGVGFSKDSTSDGMTQKDILKGPIKNHIDYRLQIAKEIFDYHLVNFSFNNDNENHEIYTLEFSSRTSTSDRGAKKSVV